MTASRAKLLETKERKKKIRNEKKDQVSKLEGKKKEMDSVKVSHRPPSPLALSWSAPPRAELTADRSSASTPVATSCMLCSSSLPTR